MRGRAGLFVHRNNGSAGYVPTASLCVLMSQHFKVVSLLPVTSSLESGLKAHWYTGPTCPLSVLMNFPSRAFQSLVELSKALDAMSRPSGEKVT